MSNMLNSLLKIEDLLKCEICRSALRQTRAVSDCGHRFCLDCVTDHLDKKGECPSCQLPANFEDLQKDTMHDSLVGYVKKLKDALLSHSLTPLEESLLRKGEEESSAEKNEDSKATAKRVIMDMGMGTQESEDYRDEYSDMPDRKKFKASSSFNDEEDEDDEDPMRMMDDILDMSSRRPTRTKKEVKYADVDHLGSSDGEDMEDFIDKSPTVQQRVGFPVTPEETATSNEMWRCPGCDYNNTKFLQKCGVCHKFQNPNSPADAASLTATTTSKENKKKGKRKASASNTPSQHAESSTSASKRKTLQADRSLEDATLAAAPITRRRSSSTALPRKEDVHIIYTSLTSADEASVDKCVEKVAESKLKISILEEVKDFSEVTHVITSVDKKKQCHRTLKYLYGIMLGKWIVTPQWLMDSMKAKKWLPEIDYQVKGDAKSGLTNAPQKGRQRLENNEDLLFADMRFYFTGEFQGSHNKKDLSLLVVAGGASLMGKKPSTGFGYQVDQDGPLDLNEPIIIYSEGLKKKKREAWLNEFQVRDPTWIINCISRLSVE